MSVMVWPGLCLHAGAEAARICGITSRGKAHMNADFIKQFERDISRHIMTVIRDDGVNRHIRFARPGTMCMHFDLLTWPGYLCYTGDMGTYVFTRLRDMFEFFRCESHEHRYQISMSYWAEKVQAADRDGVSVFSPDIFRADVREHFEQATEDWLKEPKAELWAAIEESVFRGLDDMGEHGAWVALRDFKHKAFYFRDWERQCMEYTHRFKWCCHALRWAIATYDEAKSVPIDTPVSSMQGVSSSPQDTAQMDA